MISKHLLPLVSVSIIAVGLLAKPSDAWQAPSSNQQSRRSALQTTLKWLTVPATVGSSFSLIDPASAAQETKDSLFTVYEVIPDASEALSPTIKPVKVSFSFSPQGFLHYFNFHENILMKNTNFVRRINLFI